MQTILTTRTRLAIVAIALVCGTALPAQAQDAKPAPAAAPMAPMAMPASPADAATAKPRKRRAARPSASGPTCETVSDPWGDICRIRKNAEVACSDVSAPVALKVKTARKTRKPMPEPAPQRNLRQECVDAYMRNV